MGKIVSNFFMSLDGVVDSPDQWHFPYFNDEMGAAIAKDGVLRERRRRRRVDRTGPRRQGRRVADRPLRQRLHDYFRNAATGWQHPCLDDGPVCGPTDGSPAFQGSLAGALWEFADDGSRDRRFRVASFVAVACSGPAACR